MNLLDLPPDMLREVCAHLDIVAVVALARCHRVLGPVLGGSKWLFAATWFPPADVESFLLQHPEWARRALTALVRCRLHGRPRPDSISWTDKILLLEWTRTERKIPLVHYWQLSIVRTQSFPVDDVCPTPVVFRRVACATAHPGRFYPGKLEMTTQNHEHIVDTARVFFDRLDH